MTARENFFLKFKILEQTFSYNSLLFNPFKQETIDEQINKGHLLLIPMHGSQKFDPCIQGSQHNLTLLDGRVKVKLTPFLLRPLRKEESIAV